ncbi:SURF1 family protein [Agaribacter flavus]|uniref:SURF1-like protein n=1 Tax=Agaribacter flavus TaxID=1902781 RepID=A0ABV7FT16_9ALTE
MRHSYRSVLLTIVAIACIVTMFALGFWQLERKAQKEQRILQIEQRQDANPLRLEDVVKAPASHLDFTLSLSGLALNKLFYIDNKLYEGRTGYHLIQILKTNTGNVAVNLGWVAGESTKRILPVVDVMEGHVDVSGVIAMPSNNIFVTETNTAYGEFPVRLQQLDIALMEKFLGEDVLPFVVLANAEAASPFIREWQPVVMPPEKHLGYAIQWFGLGIAGLSVFIVALTKQK